MASYEPEQKVSKMEEEEEEETEAVRVEWIGSNETNEVDGRKIMSAQVLPELTRANVFRRRGPAVLFRTDTRLMEVPWSRGSAECVGCPLVCRDWHRQGGTCAHQREYARDHPEAWQRYAEKQGRLRWKQRLLAEGNDPSYWDVLPMEVRSRILRMAAYMVHREQWAKVLAALMSFGSCCCSRDRDCEEHHPRNVLVNWCYKVRHVKVYMYYYDWEGREVEK